MTFTATLGAASAAQAGATWRKCDIVNVLVRPDSLSVRCTPKYNAGTPLPAPLPEWFSVRASSSSASYFDRVLSMLMTALAENKSVNILYDTNDKDLKNPDILTLDVFK